MTKDSPQPPSITSRVSGKLVQAQVENERRKLDRGVIGWLVGTKDHVPNNVAAFVIIVSLAAILGIMFLSDGASQSKEELAILSGMLTLSLGYLFGRASKE